MVGLNRADSCAAEAVTDTAAAETVAAAAAETVAAAAAAVIIARRRYPGCCHLGPVLCPGLGPAALPWQRSGNYRLGLYASFMRSVRARSLRTRAHLLVIALVPVLGVALFCFLAALCCLCCSWLSWSGPSPPRRGPSRVAVSLRPIAAIFAWNSGTEWKEQSASAWLTARAIFTTRILAS